MATFGKKLFTRLTVHSLCNLSVCNFSYLPLRFRGQDVGSDCGGS